MRKILFAAGMAYREGKEKADLRCGGLFSFFKDFFSFLSNLCTQCGAPTHDPAIKSHTLL